MGKIGHRFEKVSHDHRVSSRRSVPWKTDFTVYDFLNARFVILLAIDLLLLLSTYDFGQRMTRYDCQMLDE